MSIPRRESGASVSADLPWLATAGGAAMRQSATREEARAIDARGISIDGLANQGAMSGGFHRVLEEI